MIPDSRSSSSNNGCVHGTLWAVYVQTIKQGSVAVHQPLLHDSHNGGVLFGLHKQWQLCSMELKFAINAYLLVAANARQASVSWMSQQESAVTIMSTKVAKDML